MSLSFLCSKKFYDIIIVINENVIEQILELALKGVEIETEGISLNLSF